MGRDVKHSPPLDGRAERWREHRIARRVHLVDSAMTAFERHGPDANLQQIAQVAGMPKPKIYRHFDDKADLITAVGQRMRATARASRDRKRCTPPTPSSCQSASSRGAARKRM